MQVGFFTVFRGDPIHLVLADLMIRSVRQAMPDVPIVQFTDETSPAVVGVDEVRRLPHGPRDVIRTDHYIACEGDWLFCDTDIIFQHQVSPVMNDNFDIAVTDREGTLVNGEEDLDFIKATPYNLGVIFSRSSEFWKAVKVKLLTMSDTHQDWMGIQFAACAVIAEERFKVKVLPGRVFNYAPRNSHDDCSRAYIVHFKGPMRKQMMLDRYMQVGV
jgi:hypothetical protein